MTSFQCRQCDHLWNEGPTRDHRTDQLCRPCLIHKITVVRADVVRAMEQDTREGDKAALATILLTTSDAINNR